MESRFEGAENGNVALTAQLGIPRVKGQHTFDLALGFRNSKAAAKSTAQASLAAGFPGLRTDYIKGWNDYATGLKDLSAASGDGGKLYYTSAMVLKAHEDKTFDGGMIASLTVPWGTSVTDDASGDELGILPGSGPDGYKAGRPAITSSGRVTSRLRSSRRRRCSWRSPSFISPESTDRDRSPSNDRRRPEEICLSNQALTLFSRSKAAGERKIVGAREAVRLIRDGDTIATGGFVGIGFPEAIAVALEELYLAER